LARDVVMMPHRQAAPLIRVSFSQFSTALRKKT
jgi:hypothetical protein